MGHFLPFYPLTTQKMKMEKMEKKPGDIIFLHKCTKNHDHMLYCFWDMACVGYNCCFSFWATFCTFTSRPATPPPPPPKKIKKMKKKPLEIPSFNTSVPKIMIMCYTVPEIRCRLDVIVIFHFGLFFALLSP